jgi:hypothetical protein
MITPELFLAFAEVKNHFPTLSIVVIDRHGKWCYMDEDFGAFNFGDKIDVSLLEAASNSIQDTPFVFEPHSDEYFILHNVDNKKVTHCKNDSEFIDFMREIVIENKDYNYSILGISDAHEYLEDYCENLTLLNLEN